jgi:hypothetical protein
VSLLVGIVLKPPPPPARCFWDFADLDAQYGDDQAERPQAYIVAQYEIQTTGVFALRNKLTPEQQEGIYVKWDECEMEDVQVEQVREGPEFEPADEFKLPDEVFYLEAGVSLSVENRMN